MGYVYLAALIFGLGITLVQLVMSSDADGDAGDGGHTDTDLHADADSGDVDHADDVHHGGPGIGGDIIAVFLSIRFWTFAALAFGLLGTLLHYLDLAGPTTTVVMSTVTGVGSGALASWTFRALMRSTTTSGGMAEDMLGQVGKVLVPCNKGSRGKIRIAVKGQMIDYLATTDDETLEAGSTVLVEEVRGDQVHVSRAPPEFEPRRS